MPEKETTSHDSIMSGGHLDEIERELRDGEIPEHLRNPPSEMDLFDEEVSSEE